MAAGDFHITIGSHSGTASVWLQPSSGVKMIVKAMSGDYYQSNNSSHLEMKNSSSSYAPIYGVFRRSLDVSTGNGNAGHDGGSGWMNVSIPITNASYIGIVHAGSWNAGYMINAIEWD